MSFFPGYTAGNLQSLLTVERKIIFNTFTYLSLSHICPPLPRLVICKSSLGGRCGAAAEVLCNLSPCVVMCMCSSWTCATQVTDCVSLLSSSVLCAFLFNLLDQFSAILWFQSLKINSDGSYYVLKFTCIQTQKIFTFSRKTGNSKHRLTGISLIEHFLLLVNFKRQKKFFPFQS